MNLRTRLVPITLTAALSLGLGACGEEAEPTSPTDEEMTDEEMTDEEMTDDEDMSDEDEDMTDEDEDMTDEESTDG